MTDKTMNSFDTGSGFSLRRTLRLIKINASTRIFRFTVAGTLSALAVEIMAFLLPEITGYKINFSNIAHNMSSILPLVVMFIFTFSFSMIGADLSYRGNRINAIMLPAARSEKFISRIVTVLAAGPILYFIIYTAAFYLLHLLGVIFGFGVPTEVEASEYYNAFADLTPNLEVNVNGEFTMTETMAYVNLVLFGILLCSCYMTGGMIWKSKSWILTSMALICIALIVAAIAVKIPDCNYSLIENDTDIVVTWGIAAAMLILTAVNVFLSWRMMSRMQTMAPRFAIALGLRNKNK